MEDAREFEAPEFEPDALDAKVQERFAGMAVRKDLTAKMKRGANVPTFVLEYLLGMYCATDDPEAIESGLERIRRILSQNYVRPDESEAIKARIHDMHKYTIIDKVSAKLDEYRNVYVASFANLSIDPVVMPNAYVHDYPKMLTSGMWCILQMEFWSFDDEMEDELADVFGEPRKPKTYVKPKGPEDNPFKIADLTPIQMPNIDMDGMVAKRASFTTGEWMDLLLRSAGYEPDVLNQRTKMHFIERMVPLVERNYNLCELGPRGTGKSHIYSEVSPYAILLSGGQTTTANLFGRLNAKARAASMDRTGLVGNWDVIAFDEVAGMHFKDTNAIQILKGYMASGTYARGRESFQGDASLVFEGNINDSVHNILKTTHLFDPFPPEFNNDSAFFDRIHCYLPGWEVPKMRADLLTGHYGLITDCLSEFCKGMRKRDYTHHLDRYFRLNSDFNTRDENGVRKTFSGLMKLLFPDEEMTREDAQMILDYAIEGRRRVKEQLKTMAGVEFMDVGLGYVDADNPSIVNVVGVPEQSSGTLVPEVPLQPGHVFAVGRSVGDEYAVYKLENKAVAGSFKFESEGIGGNRAAREGIEAAWRFFENNGDRVAAGMHMREKDYLLFFNDLQAKGPSDEASLAEFIGLCSAACNRPVEASLVIPGVLRLSGSMDEIKGLEDILRVAKNAGARKVLLPIGCIKDLQSVSSELLGSVSPDLYPDGDAVAAARKALGI